MLSTCPRCRSSRPVLDAGTGPCAKCGYTDLIASGAPPRSPELAEPLWLTALAMCMGVSVLVFLGALLAARVASPDVATAEERVEACTLSEAPRSDLCAMESAPRW